MSDRVLRPKWNGAALTRHREARGWTVEELSQALGMKKPGLVYKWENGESMPKSDYLAALILVLNQPPVIHFFTGIDEFQGQQLKGGALISQGTTVVFEGKDTSSSAFLARDVAAADRRKSSQVSDGQSPPASANPASESTRGRRSPKRRA